MNISGKVFQIQPEAKGEGKNGPWSRQEFIIETDDQYPKKVCISVWNNKVSVKDLKPGDPVTVDVTVESREYNGRWYTDVKAQGMIVSRVEEAPGVGQTAGPREPYFHDRVPDDLPEEDLSSPSDDLPF